MAFLTMEPHVNGIKPYFHKSHDRSTIICCNCGGLGHVYARCNHPVTSYGVICYRLSYDVDTNCVYPEYLMVQRKDSLSYVEFIRGKYDLQNIDYMLRLFSNMIEDERAKVVTDDFDELWTNLWSSTNGKNFLKEYNASKEKFNKLKYGYLIRSAKNHDDVILVNLDYLAAQTRAMLKETEWGFPKGRRNFSDEDDRKCALREFKEETGMAYRNIRFVRDVKPFEEIFSGSNKIRYKHVYYIAKFCNFHTDIDENNLFDPKNKHQAREIRDVKWFSYNEAQSKIKLANVERKEVLHRLNRLILKSISNQQ